MTDARRWATVTVGSLPLAAAQSDLSIWPSPLAPPTVPTAIEWVDASAPDMAGPFLSLVHGDERPKQAFGAQTHAQKAQLIGPLTMAALPAQQRALSARDWPEAVTVMRRRMPALQELWLDEPLFDAACSAARKATLREAMNAIRHAHPSLRLGLHTCASQPPLDFRECPADVVHVDVHARGFDLSRLHLPDGAEFVPGIVPTLRPATARELLPLLHRLDATLPVTRIAPSCGLGLLSVERAAAALQTLDELSYA